MKEYILHLLHQQKSVTFNDLLKKTNLKPETLMKVILDLSKKDKTYFVNLKNKWCTTCLCKSLCKNRR